ncbi:MAG: hypothetical protein QMD04_13380 [Anaerolineales bacterium]|nr:hypothetical protein [Anaerolineales bacterium]
MDIRIVAQNDKYNYWDIAINEIIEGLRTAIKWWKTDGRYTEEEAEEQNFIDCMNQQEEVSKSFWDEMYDLGLSEDYFGGRD